MIQDLFFQLMTVAPAAESSNVITDLAGRFHVDFPRLVASAVNFGLVALALYFLAFRPVLRTMEERNRTIEDGLRNAEEMKVRLAETEAMHEEKLREASREASRLVNEAKEQAKALADRQAAQARVHADDLLRKAEESIETERKSMLEEVRREVASLVAATSAKVLERELKPEERQTFAERVAEEMAARN